MRKHNEIYKLEYRIPRVPTLGCLLNCPEKMFAFRIRDNGKQLLVTTILADDDKLNRVTLNQLSDHVYVVQSCIEDGDEMPRWLAPHPLDNVVAYCQSGCDALIELYAPLIHKLTKRMYNTLDRFYTYEDLLQQCYLTIIRLSHENYYCSKKLIERAYVNSVFMELRKLPTRYVVLSFDEPTNDTQGDDTITKLIDTIADPNDNFETIMNDAETISRRAKVIKIIGQRRYDQLVREYRTHTTSNSTTTTVNKLKRRFENEEL